MGYRALMQAAALKFRAEWRRQRATGLIFVIGALLVTQWLGPRAQLWLRYERSAVAAGEWWRLVTAHLVHLDGPHLAMNLAGLVLLWSLYSADARPRDWLVVALAAALAVGLGLYVLAPGVLWYVGLSGVLHGLWAGGGVACFARWRLEAAVTLALLAAKLALESAHGALSSVLGSALPVVTVAHLYGAVGGALAAVALGLWRRSL